MHVAQSSYPALPVRPLAGILSATLAVVVGIVTVLTEHARALRAADAAMLPRRQVAALRALYCGQRWPFS
ncbi:MAG: hypothetical protein ACREVV_08030 [Steroidobacteraceae bacterium]